MKAIADWCFKHKFSVIAIWLLAIIALTVGGKAIGNNYSDSFTLPNTESSKALNLLSSMKTGASGDQDTIVWHVQSGTVNNPAVETKIQTMLAKVTGAASVISVTSPYSPAGQRQISKDQKTAYAQVNFDTQAQSINEDNVKKVISIAEAARGPGLEVELGGSAVQQTQQTPPSSSELIGIVAAAIVLFIAFGSFSAMAVPLISAVVALIAGLQVVGLFSNFLTIASLAPTLGALIGLGVGIDYALFIINRYSSGLMGGLSPEEASSKALNTAGRAVIFAGSTVCVALLGLLTLRISFLGGVGIAAAIIVFVSVLAAVTIMPALLGLFKLRILSKKKRRLLASGQTIDEANVKGIWNTNARFVQRHAKAVAAVAIVVMAALIIPVFSLHLGSSDAGNDPTTTTTRKAYDLLADGFGPGFNGPLQIVGQISSPKDRQAFNSIVDKLQNYPGVAQVAAVPLMSTSKVGIIQVTPTTSPQSQKTSNLIKDIRKNVVPPAEKGTSLKAYVGGSTAIFDDFASVLLGKLPLFLGVIIGLGFLILLVAFRSIVVPLTAAAMNLLAAGAAFGVVVAIFQWGWGISLLGLGSAGPVESFLPVMMIAILFGLSMDYQVFLVSRMHEEWVHTKDNARAVRVGQAETGRVITSAATIMILVFLSFVLGGQRVVAEFGIGLAASVLLDAFILRNFLVPALMNLFGKANWWLPNWLDKRLPHIAVEPVE